MRTEVAEGQAFPLVTGLQPWDCKSIAKASKVRILHLPPRAEEASDQRKRGAEAFFDTRWGYPKGTSIAAYGDREYRPVACGNAAGVSGTSTHARKTSGSSGGGSGGRMVREPLTSGQVMSGGMGMSPEWKLTPSRLVSVPVGVDRGLALNAPAP